MIHFGSTEVFADANTFLRVLMRKDDTILYDSTMNQYKWGNYGHDGKVQYCINPTAIWTHSLHSCMIYPNTRYVIQETEIGLHCRQWNFYYTDCYEDNHTSKL